MKQRQVMLMINPPIPLRFDGIVRYAREHGWHLTLANRLVRAPRGWNGDGALVTLRGDAETTRFVEGLVKARIPVVDLTSYMPEVDVPRVVPDYTSAGRIAGAHFAEMGLKRVAWFSTIWTKVHSLFFDGLSERWPKTQKIVLSTIVPKTKLDDVDRFADVMSPRLLALQKPVGILTYNDEEAARILALCMEIGIKVPDEIAILGIGNDTFLCENQAVPLSSVMDDLERNGYEAASLLERLMDGARPPKKAVLVPCQGLAARRSTDILAVDSPVLRKSLEYLKPRIANPPSAVQLSEVVGVSRATLDRLFAAHLGRSMHEEVTRMRLVRAKEMLSGGAATICETAAACGFCNAGHFVNVFRQHVGLTPGRWRSSM